jgi:hypothetical protein
MKPGVLALLVMVWPVVLGATTLRPERLVVKVLDAEGCPVPGAHILTLEGNAEYVRQGLIRSDSTGTAVAEVGDDAYVGLRVLAEGFEVWRVDLEPGAPDRKRRVIEVRLLPKRVKGNAVPVSW